MEVGCKGVSPGPKCSSRSARSTWSTDERVRGAVSKEFLQPPQYGAARSAGHQSNTDDLFKRRKVDKVAAKG